MRKFPRRAAAQPAEASSVRPAESDEELFLAHYERLSAWALHLTNHDRTRAEDLTHDVFIHLQINRPDLTRVENLESYLFTIMRNMHRSQLRRLARSPLCPASTVDYDSALASLEAANPRTQLHVLEELQEVCRYVCARKESSKAASVLALRFLLGYYPSEIAVVLCSSAHAVAELLRVARVEAKSFLQDKERLNFIGDTPTDADELRVGVGQTTEDIIGELRWMLRRSRQGACLTRRHIQAIYEANKAELLTTKMLAHVVSCETCLEAVNRIHNLPPSSDRHPPDMLGPDASTSGSERRGRLSSTRFTSSPKKKTAYGKETDETRQSFKRLRCRMQSVYEHTPEELRVAVNGIVLGARTLQGETSELIVGIPVTETVEFVEVFSEQGVRLFFLDVEMPPAGEFEQTRHIGLSDGRSLEANLNFCGSWEHLRVAYNDPALTAAAPAVADTTTEHDTDEPKTTHGQRRDETPHTAFEEVITEAAPADARRSRLLDFLLWRRLFSANFWSRPATITALFAVPLICALMYFWTEVEKPSAADLLERAANAERRSVAGVDEGVRRVFDVEERRPQSGSVVARRRIEVWRRRAAGRGNTESRRVYDERGALLANELAATDGRRTLYVRGAQPRAVPPPEQDAAIPLTLEDATRLEPSVRSFQPLAAQGGTTRVEESAGAFVIHYTAPPAAAQTSRDRRNSNASGERRIIRAALTLSKETSRAVRQTFVVETANEVREYQLIETAYQRRPMREVAPAVFEPDAELLSSNDGDANRAATIGTPSGEDAAPLTPTTGASAASASSPGVASPELEIEVLRLLNAAGADAGEQTSVTRTTRGSLRVEAVVETDGRKRELAGALSPVVNNPAIEIELRTVAEALQAARRAARGGNRESSAPEIIVERAEAAGSRVAADAELRRLLQTRGIADAQADEEIRRFAVQVLRRSQTALLHAGTLRRLAARFTPAQLEAMSDAAREDWRTLLRRHAAVIGRDTFALRAQLAPVFNAPTVSGESTVTTGDADFARAAERLFALCAESDRNIRAAFTVAPDVSRAAALRSSAFWSNLRTIENLTSAVIREREQ